MTKGKKEGQYTSAGRQTDKIPLRISHRIVELFSEGLYSSPNKAVEELVSNSFDAGANNVHIVLSPDLRADDATIVVIDDGEGMGVEGLKRHWVIGKSTRRKVEDKSNRKPIGKFGIGKLSTFVLASKLTHVSKIDGKYFAATMDYSSLAGDVAKGSDAVFDEKTIEIPLRELTKEEAQLALSTWISGQKAGYKAIELFGDRSPESWTVAIMSDLKKLGKEIQIGRLRWVLRTAMPQQSDFHLFLDGDSITAPEIQAPLEHLVIGKDVVQLPPPCPEGLIAREDTNFPEDSIHYYGVYDEKLLGRITGYIEIFENELDAGKPKFEQSSGFFVYVRGRRVNEDDSGFGIERNQLRYGTFSRFRMVVHIDSLDEVLRSSRESFQQGATYEAVQNFLRAGFNLARNHLVLQDSSKTPGAIFAARVSSAAGSLTRKPLLSLAELIVKEKASPVYLRFAPSRNKKEREEFLERFEERAESPEGLLRGTEFVVLDARDGIALFELDTGKLLINLSHPFVATFQEHFTHPEKRLPLEMYAISEVLLEAQMYELGFDESRIRDVLARRDELFRQLVRTTGKRTAAMIAIALTSARNDANQLEEEMRAAIEAVGFDDVIRIGGKNKPDGTAQAYLSADEKGAPRRYKLGLEAKSGAYVSAKELGVSGLARHIEDYDLDHHLVIGNEFATSTEELSATVREIRKYSETSDGKTITLMYIDDLARLIRIASSRRIGGLSRIRQLFQTCITPSESKKWIDALEKEETRSWPYKEILDSIWRLAKESPSETVEYGAVSVDLRRSDPSIVLSKDEIKDCCRAMQVMADGVVFAYETTVEIDRRPDLILSDIASEIEGYPITTVTPVKL